MISKKVSAIISIILLIVIGYIILVVSSIQNSIPKNALYNLHLQIFPGQMTYTFFDKLSKCETYTSQTDTTFGFTLFAIPIVTQDKTQIAGIDNNYCVIENYHGEYFGRMSRRGKWYIPLDLSNDLGIFINNYMKYPEKRIELKNEFYSKYKILENQYDIIHSTNPKTGASEMKFVKMKRKEIERTESVNPTSLELLNNYIVTDNMRMRESEQFDNRQQKVNSGSSGEKVGYKGTYCNNIRCSKYSLSKKYDEITLLNPPHSEIHAENTICPYFIVKQNNNNLLIDKDENNLLGNYDSFELINNIPEKNYYFNFLKVKKNGKYGIYRLPATNCSATKLIIPTEYNSFNFETVASDTTPPYFNIITASKNNLNDLYFEYYDINKSSEEYMLLFKNIKSFEIPEKSGEYLSTLQKEIKIKDSAINKMNKDNYAYEFKKIIVDNKTEYITTSKNKNSQFFILKNDNNSDVYDLYEY